MSDLYGLDAQAAQVRARLREGGSVQLSVRVAPGGLMLQTFGPNARAEYPNRLEDALRGVLAWLEKRDAEGGR